MASNATQVGKELIQLCQTGKGMEAIEKLYDDSIVSIEARADGALPRKMQGKGEIIGKNKWWYENMEVHSMEAKGPFPHGEDRFAAVFNIDVTNKQDQQRIQMEEVGLYEVKNGKIVKEEFFYMTE